MKTKRWNLAFLTSIAALCMAGCGTAAATSGKSASKAPVTLYFGSYSVTKDVYENQLFPAFKAYWKQKTGQDVTFQASFDASGSESKSIANGLPVDVAALSLADDINRIQKAGLITHDWTKAPYEGMVTDSIVAIAVRKGNPKHIETWSDLAKPGVVVDLPNPATSGGAKWDINAIYGAALRHGSSTDAVNLLKGILHNVKVLDKSGDASMTTFVNGVGDAAVTYENSILEDSHNLKDFDEVIPQSTQLIENPIAVVDANVDKHHDRAVAEGFVTWLQSPAAQKIFEEAGFRPVNPAVPAPVSKFPKPKDLFTVSDLGGWDHLNTVLYNTNGIWPTLLQGG